MIQNPSSPELRAIATREHQLMWSIVAAVASNLLAKTIGPPALPLAVGVIAFQMYAMWHFCRAAQHDPAWLYVLLILIPCVGLIVIVLLVNRTNQLFQQRSIPVGLMGPRLGAIPPDDVKPNM